jgi:hypothetical protein
MRHSEIIVHVRVSRWLPWAVIAPFLFSKLTGISVDYAIHRCVSRAVRIVR